MPNINTNRRSRHFFPHANSHGRKIVEYEQKGECDNRVQKVYVLRMNACKKENENKGQAASGVNASCEDGKECSGKGV
jgi:hypothetical protein